MPLAQVLFLFCFFCCSSGVHSLQPGCLGSWNFRWKQESLQLCEGTWGVIKSTVWPVGKCTTLLSPCWRPCVAAPFSDGSCSTTPLEVPSVDAVIQPASPATGEEYIGVSLLCRHGCLFLHLCFILMTSLKCLFPLSFGQDPRASATNLCWDPWSSWIRLTQGLTTSLGLTVCELCCRAGCRI